MSQSVKRVLPRLRRLLEAAERGGEMDAIRCLDLIERKARHELDHNMAPDDSSARWELGLRRRAKSRSFQRKQDAHELLDWFMNAGLVEPFGLVPIRSAEEGQDSRSANQISLIRGEG